MAKKVGPASDKKKQVTVRKGAGMFEGIVTIAKSKEGIMGLYRGFGASMVNTFSTRELHASVRFKRSSPPNFLRRVCILLLVYCCPNAVRQPPDVQGKDGRRSTALDGH